MRFFALLASLFLVGLPPSAGIAGSSGLQLAGSANLGDWQTYTNARFGTGIDYPAGHFLSGTPPTNGDGLEFTGADGISGFVIFGRYNVDELPMSGLMSEDMSADQYDEITYRKWDKGWYALSGYSGDNLFYRKVILRPVDQTVHTFEITYPKSQKDMYEAVVSRMAQSFASGPASP